MTGGGAAPTAPARCWGASGALEAARPPATPLPGSPAGATAVTKRFGPLPATVRDKVQGGNGDDPPGVDWDRRLTFPGLRLGEKLERSVEMPERGTLQTRDGRVLAQGADRTGDLGPLAAEVAGRVGPIPEDRADEYAKLGYPVQTQTTLSGVTLENAHGESCGGSLGASFATSCNSVFAPLGAKLGAQRL